MFLVFDIKMVNFRLEGFAHLGSRSGKINENAAGVDHVDAKAMGLEPSSDYVDVRFCQTEAFAKFLRGQPLMEVWRTFGVEFVDELLEGFFLLRRALQLEQHVLHGKIVRHRTAIVREPCFGMGIALERHTIHFIDALRDSWASVQAGFDLCIDSRLGK